MTGRAARAALLALGLLAPQLAAPAGAQAATLRWTRTFDGPLDLDSGAGIAIGRDGGLYVVGTSSSATPNDDLLLQKYSRAGNLLWTRTYSRVRESIEVGNGIAVGPLGDVYVAGYTFGPTNDYNFLLQKYSPAGELVWTRHWGGGPGRRDFGWGVAAGSDGSVYVVGQSFANGGADARLVLCKYSASGSFLWARSYAGPVREGNGGLGVAVGPDDSVYVTGRTHRAGALDALLLQRYTPSGTLVWTRTYGGLPGWEGAGNGVAVAGDGNIYVTGSLGVPGQRYSLVLLKYSPTGVRLWSGTHDLGPDWTTSGSGVSVAPGGGVLVTGTSVHLVPGGAIGLLVMRYSSSGELRWGKQYDAGTGWSTSGTGVAVDSIGSAFVTGAISSGHDTNLLLQKYR